MGVLKKLARKVGKLFPGTGRHAAQRATEQANQFAQEAQQARTELETQTKKERSRAQKLAIKGLRSKRAASRFKSPDGQQTTYGSLTIG